MGVAGASLDGLGGDTLLIGKAGVVLSGEYLCDTVEYVEASDVAMVMLDVAKGIGNEETGDEAKHDEESSDVAIGRLEFDDDCATRGMATVDPSMRTGECGASLGEFDDSVALLVDAGFMAFGEAWCDMVEYDEAGNVAIVLDVALGSGHVGTGDEA